MMERSGLKMKPWQRDAALMVVLFLVTVGLFSPVRNHQFINYDDGFYITENAHVQAGVTWEGVKWALFDSHAHMWHPLTSLSHMMDCQLFGLDSAAHHLMNVVIHSLSAVLLFLWLRMATGFVWRAAIVAALFAWHPLRVESVAWAAERKDVLCTLFWILTFITYTWYAREQTWRRWWAVVAVYGLGIMTKPMIVTLPCALLLLDFWPLGRFARKENKEGGATSWKDLLLGLKENAWPLVREKLPLFGLSAFLAWATYHAQASAGIVVAGDRLPLIYRLMNGFVSLGRYLYKMVWPTELPVFYPHPGIWPESVAAGSVALAFAITALVIWQLPRRPWLAVGWFWFVGILAPVFGVIQAGEQSLANRYTYVSTIGLLIMVVWTLAELSRNRRKVQVAMAVLAAVAMIACWPVTRWQLAYWKDSETLFRRALEVTTENGIAHNNLGSVLGNRSDIDGALHHFEEAIRINPNNPQALRNLGIIHTAKGDIEKAVSAFQGSVKGDPANADSWFRLGTLLRDLKRSDEARAAFAEAVAQDSSHAPAQLELGRLLMPQGKFAEAEAHLTQAVALMPENPEAHFQLAVALASQSKTGPAILSAQQALRFSPDWALAMSLLAALQGQAGDFASAVATAERALALAEQQGNAKLAGEVRRRLEEFRAKVK